ncbi:hypothetical protein F8388_018571 [Cannabis sativa]|uniref:DUF8039 domain-containing protein n=1 Tax=Cannabis sativa TaxID=3483 RepID=A0A7J6EE32_CANSA|nr:hypothetical protein F8388_018571 [Cannabis sativa]
MCIKKLGYIVKSWLKKLIHQLLHCKNFLFHKIMEKQEDNTQLENNNKLSNNKRKTNTVAEKKTRGNSVRQAVLRMRAQGRKVHVDFNLHGQSLGKSGNLLQSYLGWLARSKRGPPHTLTEPPKDYIISAEEWKKLVASRTSNVFKEQRKVQQQRRSQQKYAHRTARKSIANIEYEMQKERNTTDPIDRGELWKRARQNNKGSYLNDETREKRELISQIEKIALQKQPSQPSDTNDVDATVHHNISTNSSKDIPTPESHLRSSTPSVKGIPCSLLVEPDFKLVAKGYIIETISSDIHGKPIGDDKRVTISEAIVPKAKLPVKVPGVMELVEEAVDSCVAWPTHLVVIPKKATSSISRKRKIPTSQKEFSIITSKPKEQPPKLSAQLSLAKEKPHIETLIHPSSEKEKLYIEQPTSIPSSSSSVREKPLLDLCEIPKNIPASLKSLIKSTFKLNKEYMYEVPIPKDICGLGKQILYIGVKDLLELAKFKEISASVITLYIRKLHACISTECTEHLWCFAEPSLLAFIGNNTIDARTRYLSLRLQNTLRGGLLTLPYHPGRHWMLILINPWQEIVFSLNPSGQKIGDDAMTCVRNAFAIYNASKGRRGNRNGPKWITVQFKGKVEYTMDEINELREEWTEALMDHMA